MKLLTLGLHRDIVFIRAFITATNYKCITSNIIKWLFKRWFFFTFNPTNVIFSEDTNMIGNIQLKIMNWMFVSTTTCRSTNSKWDDVWGKLWSKLSWRWGPSKRVFKQRLPNKTFLFSLWQRKKARKNILSDQMSQSVPWLRTASVQNYENTHFFCLSHSVYGICWWWSEKTKTQDWNKW